MKRIIFTDYNAMNAIDRINTLMYSGSQSDEDICCRI